MDWNPGSTFLRRIGVPGREGECRMRNGGKFHSPPRNPMPHRNSWKHGEYNWHTGISTRDGAAGLTSLPASPSFCCSCFLFHL